MKKRKLRKKHIPSFYFTKISKSGNKLNELIEIPLILEMKNGEFYAGMMEDREKRTISVTDCRKLVNRKISAINPYTERVWEECSGDDFFTSFPMKTIKNIFCAKDESLLLDQMLDLSINPWYGSIKGIICDWNQTGKHSKFCNEDLHNAMTKLYKDGNEFHNADYDNPKPEKERKEFDAAFQTIRRFIIENKGRIP